jgi:glycosyltransferase involved in cell wall biosynthesis
MDRPLVSIVITSYNYAHYLPLAIDSALGQDYAPLEVLVLDNASTDDTPAVLERYAADPRFRAVRNETNIGLTQNHNKGLVEARGEYILFLSADDALTPGCIARAMRYYDEHPDVDLIYASAYFMDVESKIFSSRQMTGQPLCTYAGGRNELAAILSEGCYMCTPTMLVPRAIWERYGGFDESMHGADWEISARWASKGLRFAYIPEAFAIVRIHPGQHSGEREYVSSGRDMREYLDIVDRYLDMTTPERYAGYEQAIRRLLDSREYWYRKIMGDATAEYDSLLAALRSRLTAIAAINAERERRRVCYVVIAENMPGPLEATLRSLVAQRDPNWRAVVVQRPHLSYEPLCRMIDPDRVRLAHIDVQLHSGANINTAFRIQDADIYTVARAGTIYAPDHAEALVATFADPGARLAVTWPRFFIDPLPNAPGTPIEIEELSAPPSGAFDVLVGPEVPPEAVSFAREVFDLLGGYNLSARSLLDWEFLIRATFHSAPGFRQAPGGVEVHLMPITREFSPVAADIPALVEQMHLAYPVTDLPRLNARTAYLDRLRAAHRFQIGTQDGLCDFYRTLARTGISV